MGTNYYLYKKPCESCGHSKEILHIGKSSAGWCFSLHVIPERKINSLVDWEVLFNTPGNKIVNEYGEDIAVTEMMETIKNRSGSLNFNKNCPNKQYALWADFHDKNQSVAGPKGLLRHRLRSNWCIAHGEGTFDLILGDFS